MVAASNFPDLLHDRCHGKPDWSCPRCEVIDDAQRTPPRFRCTEKPHLETKQK